MNALIESLWRDGWDSLLDAIYPPKCRLCGVLAESDLACDEHRLSEGLSGPRCERCSAKLSPALPDGSRCAECRRRRPAFRRVIAMGDYAEGAMREWLLALKHGGRLDLAGPLGALLAERLGTGMSSADQVVLVPVPLHPTRRFQRGYDQARALAESAGRAGGFEVVRALKRSRATVPQGTPGAVSRTANVRSAFRASKTGASKLGGRTVWLVDDVLTSGATASECTRILHRAGAKTAGVLVVARAGLRVGEPGTN